MVKQPPQPMCSKWSAMFSLCGSFVRPIEQECSGLTTRAIKVRSTRDLTHKSGLIIDLSDGAIITDAKNDDGVTIRPMEGRKERPPVMKTACVRPANDKEGNSYR